MTRAFLDASPRSKVLVVTPTKELREQFVEMGGWMGLLEPRKVVLNFREPLSNSRRHVRRMVDVADVVVSTPELFTNRFEWLSTRAIDALTLCILDEVDLWPIEDFEEPESVRYHRALAELQSRLVSKGTRFLGLTASPLSRAAKTLLVGDLGCRELHPFHPSIVKYLPRVRVEPIRCADNDVVGRDREISRRTFVLLRQLENELGTDVLATQRHNFWLLIRDLAGGSRGADAARLAISILNSERERIQLYEDTLAAGLGSKSERAKEVAKRGLPSVVYCREIQLVNRIASDTRLPRVAIAHSELGDRYLNEIDKFKKGIRDVLVMTRELGKRGIDFPNANSLILISPKSSPLTMDQELCRTRGQRHHREAKPVYVLFYESTYEEEKLRRVLIQLLQISMYDRFPKFFLSPEWRKWLASRAGLALPDFLRKGVPGS